MNHLAKNKSYPINEDRNENLSNLKEKIVIFKFEKGSQATLEKILFKYRV